MTFPEDRLYSEYHLWIKTNDNFATIGITDYAKEELGNIDYVELPQIGDSIIRSQPFGTLETSKAITDLIAPISGTVTECNDSLAESPQTITEEPYSNGWLVVAESLDPKDMDQLMTADVYEKLVVTQTEE